MKKILFSGYTLDVGGIEIALVNLLNELIKKYEITLVLEKKQGMFLKELNPEIKIIEYNPNQNKNVLIRKTLNLLKRINFVIKYKNKYDFAASFTTYSKMGSFCARTASKNNALWVHTDYVALYKNNKEEISKFFNFINYNNFKNIIFVSKVAQGKLVENLKIDAKKEYINNLIDANKILKNYDEKIELKKENITTFLNVCRHEEEKRLELIIDAAEKLKNDNEEFKIIFIGEGTKTKEYKELVMKKGLENTILFMGLRENPYPYFKISDCLLVSSCFEGYPVVFNEARVLNLPIITTDVSDARTDIDGKFGIVVEDEEELYQEMKRFIKNGYKNVEIFNVENYNKEILNKIGDLISGK